MSIQKLKALSLHDHPLNSLSIEFEAAKLIVIVEQYNEESGAYDKVKLCFRGIDNLNMGFLKTQLKDGCDVEVYSASVTTIGEIHTVDFLILTGFGEPSANLTFDFEEVEIY